jgi:hypothetical protein
LASRKSEIFFRTKNLWITLLPGMLPGRQFPVLHWSCGGAPKLGGQPEKQVSGWIEICHDKTA